MQQIEGFKRKCRGGALLLMLSMIPAALAQPVEVVGENAATGTFGTKVSGIQAEYRDDTLTLTAKLDEGKIGYAFADLKVAPFTIAGKSLELELQTDDPRATSAFYVRGLAADGRTVFSFQRRNGMPATARTAVFTPGQDGFARWEPQQVKAPKDTPVVRLRIVAGTGRVGELFGVQVRNIRLKERTQDASAQVACEDLGVAARTAEIRSIVTGRDRQGKPFILCRPQDRGPQGYLLYTDVESGETFQYFNPETVRQEDNFGSVLSRDGKYYYDQRGHVLEFDVNTRETRYLGCPDAANIHYMVYTEAPDGKIYMGGYPRAALALYDPATGKFHNFGRLDEREQYVGQLAVDRDGWVYAGIGTARANIVALNPATGEKIQILPEAQRRLGYGNVIAGEDGYVYGSFGDFRVKLLGGKIVEHSTMQVAPRSGRAAKFGTRLLDFEDGAKVLRYSIDDREILLCDPDGKVRTLKFDYRSGGVDITSIGGQVDDRLFASTSHPMHLVEIDTRSGKLIDLGLEYGGNFCSITSVGNQVYACEYPGGRLWAFDPALPSGGLGLHAADFGERSTAELGAVVRAENGYTRQLGLLSILTCRAEPGKDATFTFPMTVPGDGEWYLHAVMLHHADADTVTLACGGERREVVMQTPLDQTRSVSLGPFSLKAGETPVVFTLRGLPDEEARLDLAGLKLDREPLRELPVAFRDNPRVLARWADLLTRPRAILAHPDGRHLVVCGFANYGLTGGGFGIYDRESGHTEEIRDWLPGHSCIALTALPGGDLAGGTSIAAPGGGHQVAHEAALFRLDWKTRKVSHSLTLPGCTQVIAVAFWKNRLVAATGDGRLLFLNPETWKVEFTVDISEWGMPQRHGLLTGAGDRLFLIQRDGISEISPKTSRPVRLAAEKGISAGGAVAGGFLYCARGPRILRCPIPPVTPNPAE